MTVGLGDTQDNCRGCDTNRPGNMSNAMLCVANVNPSSTRVSSRQQALVQMCLVIVKEHQNGNITLAQATIQIFGILPDDKFGTKAFMTYVEQLAQTDQNHLLASVQGSGIPSSAPVTLDANVPVTPGNAIVGSSLGDEDNAPD